jgi:hypothetical protein
MAPKYHPTPLSGGDRKALSKELVKSRAMTGILAERSQEKRRVGEALIREADNLACQSWNEKMWSDGGPAQPSPTIGQAINGGFPWLEVKCYDGSNEAPVIRSVRGVGFFLSANPLSQGSPTQPVERSKT